jgi:hypothetical protein
LLQAYEFRDSNKSAQSDQKLHWLCSSEAIKRVNDRKPRIILAAQYHLDRRCHTRFLCFKHKPDEKKTNQIRKQKNGKNDQIMSSPQFSRTITINETFSVKVSLKPKISFNQA